MTPLRRNTLLALALVLICAVAYRCRGAIIENQWVPDGLPLSRNWNERTLAELYPQRIGTNWYLCMNNGGTSSTLIVLIKLGSKPQKPLPEPPPLPAAAALPPAPPKITTVSIAWDASPSPGVAGYNVYFGTNTGQYPTSFFTPGLTATVQCASKTYFAVTAQDSGGLQSDFSNEAIWTPPSGPTNADLVIGLTLLNSAGVTVTNIPGFYRVVKIPQTGQEDFKALLDFTVERY